jgi:hypothetical protein
VTDPVVDSLTSDSISTGELYNDLPAAASIGASQTQRTIHHQGFTVTSKTKLFDSDDLSWTSEPIYWPCVIEAGEVFDNPLSNWYMYYSEDHTSGAIGLRHADDPLDPTDWTDEGPVFDAHSGQDETPWAVYDPANSRLNLYYHAQIGTTQKTGLATTATSNDGTSFTDQGVVIDTPSNTPGDGHTGYARVYRFGRDWIAYHLMGGGNYPRYGVSYSRDGVNWTTDPRPLTNGIDMTDDPNRRMEWLETNIVNYNGALWWVGATSAFKSGTSTTERDIKFAPMVGSRRVARTPETIIDATESFEGSSVSNPCWTVVDSEPVIFYTANGSPQGIAVAELEGGVY